MKTIREILLNLPGDNATEKVTHVLVRRVTPRHGFNPPKTVDRHVQGRFLTELRARVGAFMEELEREKRKRVAEDGKQGIFALNVPMVEPRDIPVCQNCPVWRVARLPPKPRGVAITESDINGLTISWGCLFSRFIYRGFIRHEETLTRLKEIVCWVLEQYGYILPGRPITADSRWLSLARADGASLDEICKVVERFRSLTARERVHRDRANEIQFGLVAS